jgi:hypothetical protein
MIEIFEQIPGWMWNHPLVPMVLGGLGLALVFYGIYLHRTSR